MRLFIPKLGTKLRLTEQWTFEMYCEDRNQKLWDLFGAVPMASIPWQARRGNHCTVTLQPGDVLTVDRIFIRKGAESYNSVTFKGRIKVGGVFHPVRFWVPLADANNIECEVVYA